MSLVAPLKEKDVIDQKKTFLSNDGKPMNKFYQILSDEKGKFQRFPSPSIFSSFKNCQTYYDNFYEMHRPKLISPILISGFYRRPKVPPIFLKIPEYTAKIELPRQNYDYAIDLVLTGKEVDSNQLLPVKALSRYDIKVSDLINTETKLWNTQLIEAPPIPEIYDLFEDFEGNKEIAYTFVNSLNRYKNNNQEGKDNE